MRRSGICRNGILEYALTVLFQALKGQEYMKILVNAASGGMPSALSKCATILMAMLSIVVLAGCRYEAVDANADVVDYIIRGDARGASKCCPFPLDESLARRVIRWRIALAWILRGRS